MSIRWQTMLVAVMFPLTFCQKVKVIKMRLFVKSAVNMKHNEKKL
jgi:hypothetical protein